VRRRTRAGHAGAAARAVPAVPGAAREVLLAWARDRAGAKVHAGDLAARDRRGRAPFTCLGCGEPLVPHLGKVRARHFAHLPGSRCPLTAPETALHLDAKERLLALCAEAFAGARRVTLLARCPACRRTAPRDLAAVGDAAVAEGAVGPLRADVLVLARGAPALAFEVKVSHAVDAEKEAALAAAGVPALELDATGEWLRDGGDGPEVVAARSLGFAPCPPCAALARADADVVLMAAAVADYRPAEAHAGKRPKTAEPWTVDLVPTADVARALGAARREGQVLVAFGAESGEEGLARKRAMLTDKNVDLVVYNDVGRDDIGFDSEENEVVLVTRDSERTVAKAPKDTIARAILDEVERLLDGGG